MQKRSVSADSLGPARPATRMRPACGIAQTLRRAAEGACGPRVDVGRGRGMALARGLVALARARPEVDLTFDTSESEREASSGEDSDSD